MDLNQQENGSVPMLDVGRIDQLPEQNKYEFLSHCIKKLRHGGQIKIQGLHLVSACKSFLFSQTPNKELFLNLQSITDLTEIQQFLQQNNIKIISIKLNNGIYTIEGLK